MGRRLAQAGLLIVVVLVVAQFVHPDNSSPPIDPGRTIAAHLGTGSGVVAVLDRSCAECHSNVTTTWPWYLRMAPVSWVVIRGVEEGRHAVNFSEWGGYS